MSSFVVNLHEPPEETSAPFASSFEKAERRRRWRKYLLASTSVVLAAVLTVAAGGYLYWQHLKTTPQYSLALIVDASRRGDKQTADDLVDINALVNDFVPQVTAKAVEIYGRGLSANTIAKISALAVPLMPAIKDRARAELPNVVRDRTEGLQSIPFFAMVLGADEYLDIKVNGDAAVVTSKLPDHPFEMKMRRISDRWRITGVRDDQIATMIAQKIGQQIVAIASSGDIKVAGDTLGVRNLGDIIEQAEDIFDEE